MATREQNRGMKTLRVNIPDEAKADLRRSILKINVHRPRYMAGLGLCAALVLNGLALFAPANWFSPVYGQWRPKLLTMRILLGGICILYFVISIPAARERASNRSRIICDMIYRLVFSVFISLWLGLFTPLMQAAAFYLLGVLMMAVFLISPPVILMATFSLCLLSVLGSTLAFSGMIAPSALEVLVNAVLVTLLAMAASYYVYIKEVREFLQNRTIARQNRELERYAMIDGLTGVANRRRFDMVLTKQWKRALEKGRPLALILADIDYFKAYNDANGHLAGDDCLKAVAQTLAKSVSRDSAGSGYGGGHAGV